MKQRFYTPTVEYRVEESENNVKLTGYAAVFDELSGNLGGFREKISPGAFEKAIGSSDVRALFNHDPNYVLGRTGAGTLRLGEDENGLKMEIDLPNTQFARDLAVLIERGDISQQSFGFTIGKDGQSWEENENGVVRTLHQIEKLYDVSPVTYPAYPATVVGVRAQVFGEFTKAKEVIARDNVTALRLAHDYRSRSLDINSKLLKLNG